MIKLAGVYLYCVYGYKWSVITFSPSVSKSCRVMSAINVSSILLLLMNNPNSAQIEVSIKTEPFSFASQPYPRLIALLIASVASCSTWLIHCAFNISLPLICIIFNKCCVLLF